VVEIQAYTRITLALDIVRRIPDGPLAGYHEIAAVKHQTTLHDTVRVDDARQSSVRCDPADGVPQDETNVCMRAVRLLQKRCGAGREAAVSIAKRIPVMGGLAGGSADAAATITALCRLWGLSLSRAEMLALGRELGMDVPYFFVGGTALDRETAGDPSPVTTSLSLDFVLVVPRFGVPTREAYAGLDYRLVNRNARLTAAMVEALGAGDRAGVARSVHNDFAATVYGRYPGLARLEKALLEQGCDAAWMSGSGSTMVGLARDQAHARRVAAVLGADPEATRVLCSRTLTAGSGLTE